MFQSGMKSLPLLLRLGVIDRGVPRHVGIFLVDDVEIGRGAQEDLFWHVAGMVARRQCGGKARKTKFVMNAVDSSRGTKPENREWH